MRKPNAYDRTELYFIRWVGTRGTALLILGTMWIFLGLSFLANPMERFSRPGAGGILDFLDKGPGVYIFSAMWLVGGLVAIVAAVLRPHTCEDGWGYIGVILPPLLWDAGYWWSWFAHVISNGEFGRPRAYIVGLVYASITLHLMFVAKHLPDHPEGPCAGRRSVNNS